MELNEVKEKADWRRPVLARVPISGDANNYVLCERIMEVSYVVPNDCGGYWTAVCIAAVGKAAYRVRIEDIKEA
jgi:hypothetical protein